MRLMWKLGFFCLVVLALSQECTGQTSPAFLWTSSGNLISSPGITTIHQVVESSDVLSALLQSAQEAASLEGLSTKELQSTDGLVTVLVSGQAARSSLVDQTPEAVALRKSIQAARSSIYLPNVLQNGIGNAGADSLQIGTCQLGVENASLEELKAKLVGQQLTIRVCEDDSSSHLQEVEDILQESKQPYIMAYFGQSDKMTDRPVARSLLQSEQKQVLCSDKCRTQVMLFECIILLVILLWALWIGMNMLHILDTPSRFETEKKEQNRHQD